MSSGTRRCRRRPRRTRRRPPPRARWRRGARTYRTSMVSRVGLARGRRCRRRRNRTVERARHARRRAEPRCTSAQPDPRLCPCPLCGGYWVALANGARTRCARRAAAGRAATSRARSTGTGRPLASLPAGALARAERSSKDSVRRAAPRSARRQSRVRARRDSGAEGRLLPRRRHGHRCVRAPCFSFRAAAGQRVVAASRSRAVDLAASGATAAEIARARVGAATRRTGCTRAAASRRPRTAAASFRALRLYLRAPLPRA